LVRLSFSLLQTGWNRGSKPKSHELRTSPSSWCWRAARLLHHHSSLPLSSRPLPFRRRGSLRYHQPAIVTPLLNPSAKKGRVWAMRMMTTTCARSYGCPRTRMPCSRSASRCTTHPHSGTFRSVSHSLCLCTCKRTTRLVDLFFLLCCAEGDTTRKMIYCNTHIFLR
jgi:hypothetical protein